MEEQLQALQVPPPFFFTLIIYVIFADTFPFLKTKYESTLQNESECNLFIQRLPNFYARRSKGFFVVIVFIAFSWLGTFEFE